MSLVNKMLRDLDARRAGETERAALPVAVTPLAARQAPPAAWPKWAALVVMVLAVLVALAAWALLKSGSGAPAPAVTSVPAPPIPASAPEASPVPPPTPASGVSPAPGVSPAATQDKSLQLDYDLSLKSSVPTPAATTPSPVAPPAATAKPAPPSTQSAQGRREAAVAATAPTPRIDKQERLPTPAERAEAEYRQGREAQRGGHLDEAVAHYQAALAASPEQAAARQALAALLIEARRWDAAEQVLREGLEVTAVPAVRMGSALTLARLLVERNQSAAALDVMERQAASGERSAEYQGFLAVLLNRAGRAHEAVEHYQAATRLAPDEARWWAGLGIALDADGQSAAAREAYLKAKSLPGLPPELVQHIEQRLR